jgi:polar amino acid transport system substrate-binding protein
LFWFSPEWVDRRSGEAEKTQLVIMRRRAHFVPEVNITFGKEGKEMTLKSLKALMVLVLAMGLVSWAHGGTLDDIAQRGELRIAVQTQGPPFSFVDKNGERTGSSVELVKMMAEEMGVKAVFLDFDWDGLIPALLAKKADVLAADMTPTLKRAMRIAFSKPFMYTGSVAFMKADSPIKTLEDCRKPGLKIAVLLGSTGETDAKNAFPQAELKSYKGGGPLLIDAVLKGHADIGVNDSSAVTGQMANFPPDSIRILPDMISKLPLAFAVRYDSMDLLEWINLFFLHISLDGRLDQNLDYWVNTLQWKEEH